jgi:UDP-N-acetylmuramate dehydrogenase
MKERDKEEFINLSSGRLLFDQPMSLYTTLGVGGPADAVIEVKDPEGLKKTVRFLNSRQIPYRAIGRGSNLLVTGKGFEGVIIILKGDFVRIMGHGSFKGTVRAGAGAALAELLQYCRKVNLGGLEFLSWVPGTVGGAVAMNAGAFDEETCSYIKALVIMTREGELMKKNSEELDFSYRRLELDKGSIITDAEFELRPEKGEAIEARIARFLKKRKDSQPLAFRSAGSIFKNPPDDYAGRLIEKAGLKGRKIGGAMISDRHANFIVNLGDASADDIIRLMELARKEVKKQTGVELEPEVKVIGC